MKIRPYWAMVILFLLAAALRLYRLDLTTFSHDEAYITLLAYQMLESGQPIFAGIASSIGIANPPLVSYLHASVLVFTQSPLAVIAVTALLNAAAVPLTFLAVRRSLGDKVAFVAALLFAVNPWAIYLSRKVSVQGLTSFFTALVLFALCRAIVDDKPTYIVFALAALGLMVQTYLIAAVCVGTVVLALAIFWKRAFVRPLLLGLAMFVLISAPYLLGYIVPNVGEVVSRVVEVLAAPGASLDGEAAKYAMWLATGFGIEQVALNTGRVEFAPLASWLVWLYLALCGVLVIGLARAAWLAVRLLPSLPACGGRDGEGGGAALVLITFVVPIVLMSRHRTPVLWFYLATTWPAAFILLAIPFGWLLDRSSRFWRAVAVAALLVIISLQLAATFQVSDILNRIELYRGQDSPLKYFLAASEQAKALTMQNPASEIYVATEGTSPADANLATTYAVLLRPFHARFVDGIRCLVAPPNGRAVYLVDHIDPVLEGVLGRWGREVEEARVTFPAESQTIRLFVLDPAAIERAPSTRSDIPLANGLRLVGYDLPGTAHSSDLLSLVSVWRFDRVSPDEAAKTWRVFNHVLSLGGRIVAQQDDWCVSPTDDQLSPILERGALVGDGWSEWRVGATVAHLFPLMLPADLAPGDYPIETGMYDLATLVRAARADGRGDVISLGSVSIR